MNARLVGAALLLAMAATSLACKKDETSPSPAPAPTTSASAAPVTAEALPSRAAEEQKANQEITPDNYKAQLDQLEKEIDNP